MSAIRSAGNKSTEKAFRAALVKLGISGWRVNEKDLPGKPDFFFADAKIAIFIDGCFWHGCKKCSLVPRYNTKYWKPKISGNMSRDKRISRQLRKMGIDVIRIWEHELRDIGAQRTAIKYLRDISSA